MTPEERVRIHDDHVIVITVGGKDHWLEPREWESEAQHDCNTIRQAIAEAVAEEREKFPDFALTLIETMDACPDCTRKLSEAVREEGYTPAIRERGKGD